MWSGGILCLSGVTDGTVSSSTINSTEDGGIQIRNGSRVWIENCEFDMSRGMRDEYSSVKHNILCDGSEVNLTKMDGQNISNTSSLWIYDHSCSITAITSTSDSPPSTYFVPILKDVSVSFDGAYQFKLIGSNLIPCGMECRFSFDGKEEKNKTITLSAFTQSSDEQANISFSESELPPDIDRVTVTLLFRRDLSSNEMKMTETKSVKLPSVSSGEYVVVLIAVSGFGGILFVIVIGCVVWRCVKGMQRKKESRESEYTDPLVAISTGSEDEERSVDSSRSENPMELSDDQEPAFEGGGE